MDVTHDGGGRSAVVRLDPDPTHSRSADPLDRALDALEAAGITLHSHRSPHEIEVVLAASDVAEARERAVAAWTAASGLEPAILAVTLVSRGADADVAGVLAAFGLEHRLERRRESDDDEEVVVVTLDAAHRRRTPEARLHTALEAALNGEVRIVYADFHDIES